MSETRDRIKAAAQRLFAERGLEAVSVRDIVAGAGARNGGSLNYYFQSKEELITELLHDLLRAWGTGWLEAITRMEREGGPRTVRDVIDAAVRPPIPKFGDDRDLTGRRFLASVLFTRRRIVSELMKQLDYAVFNRLLSYIIELRSDFPEAVIKQRLVMLAWYLLSAQSALEAVEATGRRDGLWFDCDPLGNIVDTATGIIDAPISDEVMSGVKAAAAKSRRSRQTADGRAGAGTTGRSPAVKKRAVAS